MQQSEQPNEERLKYIQENSKFSIVISMELLRENPSIVKQNDSLYIFNGKYYDLLEDKELEEIFHIFVLKYGILKCWSGKYISEVVKSVKRFEKIPEVEGKFDYVEAHHIFEHIESTKQLKKIMQWVYDLLEEGGTFDITVPYWHSESAVECIEHVRFFNENSFMNYYSNPYAKEMNLPQFNLVVSELRDHVNHKEVHVCLTK